jgi:hypothetical protein
MFIPMGTVVTACMLLTVVLSNRFPAGGLNKITPAPILRTIGVLTGAAGLWNVLWYGLRHLNEFWGQMALGSGVLMLMLSVLLVLPAAKHPTLLSKLRPFAVVALLAFALKYGWTIYTL